MPTALVTGATSGIGLAFARRLAGTGHDLVLVARDADRLARVAAELRAAHRVQVEVLPADLTVPERLQAVADRLADPERPVHVLVNNAGFGTRQRLVGGDLETELRSLDLMVKAVLVLSHAAAPGMVARGRGLLVTVSSVAGFFPAGSYSAAKSWATTFTRGLAAQLAGTGVHAIAFCPGFVRTEFHQRAGIRAERIPRLLWLDADAVVARCLADAARGRAVCVPALKYKVVVAGFRLLPMRLVDARQARRGGRQPWR
jgi:uncharacterized protein